MFALVVWLVAKILLGILHGVPVAASAKHLLSSSGCYTRVLETVAMVFQVVTTTFLGGCYIVLAGHQKRC